MSNQRTMSSVESLREFVNERLTAAAEEIFRVFKTTIVQYEEEIDRQRAMLDICWKPQVKLHRIEPPQQHVCKEEEVLTDQQLCNQERNSSLDQKDPEPPEIKEEQEELCTSQEGEQLVLKVETDTVMLTPTYEESDHREAEPTSDHQLLSNNSHVAESRDQKGGKHGDSGSAGDGEPKKKKRRHGKDKNSTSSDIQHNTHPVAGQHLAFNSPSTPLHGRDQPLSSSLQTDEKKLLNAISGLSRQLTLLAADVNEQVTVVNSRLLTIESKNCVEETNSKKRRRVHNPKIAEAVRRLHNSQANCRRYKPEQGLSSSHNEAVTSCLLRAMSASPDLHDADNDAIVSACKTYYETVRRSFRYKQPDLASQAEAAKSSARSRSRRKRLLEARQSVLAEDEVDLWKCATIDLMSDEEDGIVDGVSGWIVRPPSFRSRELTKLCATLQSRLEAIPKYRATHHRRLQNGPYSDRMPPVTYSSEVANNGFTVL
ncbi:uncharacterized protein LOC115592913 [Sparus aurata]|uniref:uncharacterized protein LOC115592913 n=1 Tax=Sparus aurata TaxID=8175 RepID=UPI0011C10943|nr:uncharacterized protein C14orf93 homolog [Sparus aurata]